MSLPLGVRKSTPVVFVTSTSGRDMQQYRKNLIENEWGRDYNHQHEKEISSGAPAGTEVYVDIEAERFAEDPIPDSLDIDVLLLHLGQDGDLFDKVWPRNAVTGRPLPQGTYRFYWFVQGPYNALCDGVPELVKTRDEVIVTVTASEGTLHEAFFDPVTLASGVGADSSNGVLNPASFSVDGTSTSITGLKWESGSVVLSLSPYSSLSGHKLDFIELDGSVSLSLAVSSATEDSSAGTLSWSVSDQPWHNGDLRSCFVSFPTTDPPLNSLPPPRHRPKILPMA